MSSDPTPGDPERVEELANDLADFADAASEAYQGVQDLLNDDAVASFQGEVASEFKDRFDDVPGNLKKLWDSYALAADALAAYWPRLADAQADADSALVDAQDAQSDLTSAEGWLERASSAFDDAEEAAEDPDADEVSAEVRRALSDAESDRGEAESAVASAQGRLSAAKALAEQAKEARESAARTCADGLSDASDAGIPNKSWWQKLIDWVVDAWDTIVSVAKMVVAVLGVIVMIVGGPLAWVVLAAAVIVLADSIIKYANGEGSFWDVAFSALDCIPGFKGITTVAGLATGVKSYVKNFSNMKSMFGAEGIRGVGKVLIGDPIDIATGEMTLRNSDLDLPGVLPLVLEREHLSHYRHGHWFGKSWASTLDQRLHLDQFGVHYFADDGMVLHYPIPNPDFGEPVLPVEGPRWPLAWDGDPGSPMTLTQTETGRTLHFRAVPGHRGAALPLIAVTDRNTNRIDIHYNETGEPAEIAHSGGYRVGIGVYEDRITSYTLLSDPDQPVLRAFDYDERGNLSHVYNSSGLPLRFEYDRQRRMTRWEDRNNTWYRYAYDTHGRCVFTTGTERALEYRYHYDTTNRITTATNSLGHTTVYRMNDRYQVVSETDPLGHTTHKEWSPRHDLLALTDPLGRTTRYAYDPAGNLTTVTRADGSQTHVEYNDLHLPVEVVRPDGSRVALAYDAAGNPTVVHDAAGNRTRRGYLSSGGLGEFVDELGHVTTVRCDAAGLPVEVTDPEGGTTVVVRDAFGRPRRIVDPEGGRTLLQWTVEGRVTSRTDALGATETYTRDPEGNPLTRTDVDGGVTAYTYGPFDLPSTRTAPDGVTHTFTRDTELHLTAVTDPLGRTWHYTLDPAGRITAETDYDGGTTTYSRDPAGQVTAVHEPAGGHLVVDHDLLGRLVGTSTSAGERHSYAYDPLGRVVHATSPGVDLTRSYTLTGELASETVNGRTLTLDHDTCGQVVARRTPSGHHTTRTWSPDGLPRSLTTDGRLLTFRHDAVGRETGRAVGEHLTLSQEWDPVGRLTRHRLQGAEGRIGVDRSYRYRPDHHLTRIADHLTGTASTFTLDHIGRITTAHTPAGTEGYSYLPTGDQEAARWSAPASQSAVGDREYTGSLLTRAGGTRYEHDAAGRTTLRQRARLSRKPDTWRYEWNAHGHLIRTTTPDGTVWTYTYDPFGRRVSKQRHGREGEIADTTVFTWHHTALVEETHLPTGATRTWNHNGVVPLTQTDHAPAQEEYDRRFHAIVTDLVGTPTHLVDDTGTTVWQHRTTVWGHPSSTAADGAATPLRFPGQYADEETGWHYNFHRHYDPETARYTTPDPLGLAPAPNPHTYPHNPLTWSDPLGLAAHSKTLGDNMTNAGTVRPNDTAAHHIVASGATKAAPARQHLASLGIDFNDQVNGIFLPRNSTSPNPNGVAVHSTVHTNDYYNYVNTRVATATTRQDAIRELDAIRTRLQAGNTTWP